MSSRGKFFVFMLAVCFFAALVTLPGMSVKADSNQPITFSSGLTQFTLYSPVNTTYSSNVIECNGTFNWPKPFQVSLNYSIDGEDQGGLPWNLDVGSISNPYYSTIAGSFQLPQLPNGPHQLSIGIDEELFNNTGTVHELLNQTSWVSTVYFTVSASQPTPTLTPTPTPTTTPTSTPTVPEFSSWTLPLLLSIMAATAGLLVYGKKRKHCGLVKKP